MYDLGNHLYFRILQFTSLQENAVCVVDALYKNYSQYCMEQNEIPVSHLSFTRQVSNVYNLHTSNTTTQCKNVKIYKGLTYSVNKAPSIFSTLESCTLPKGWFIMTSNESEFITGKETGHYHNDNPLLLKVCVFPYMPMKFYLGSIEIDPLNVGLSNSILDGKISFIVYLNIINDLKICTGKEVVDENQKSVKWSVGGCDKFSITSPSCSKLMPITSRGNICRNCHSMKTNSTLTETELYSDDSSAEALSDVAQPELQDVVTNTKECKSSYFNTPDEELFNHLFPNANETLLDLLKIQSKLCQYEALGKDNRAHRWPSSIISLALSIYIASPVAYRILSKTMHFPSERLLQLYKNNIDKAPGINEDMVRWMHTECERTETPKAGGIIFDEMHIQPGLELEPSGDGLKMFGYVDHGPHNSGLNQFLNKDEGLPLAYNLFFYPSLGSGSQ